MDKSNQPTFGPYTIEENLRLFVEKKHLRIANPRISLKELLRSVNQKLVPKSNEKSVN